MANITTVALPSGQKERIVSLKYTQHRFKEFDNNLFTNSQSRKRNLNDSDV